MSKRDKRIAKAHMIDYNKLATKPQRGVIVFGAGLDRARWMDDASNARYFVEDHGNFASLK